MLIDYSGTSLPFQNIRKQDNKTTKLPNTFERISNNMWACCTGTPHGRNKLAKGSATCFPNAKKVLLLTLSKKKMSHAHNHAETTRNKPAHKSAKRAHKKQQTTNNKHHVFFSCCIVFLAAVSVY